MAPLTRKQKYVSSNSELITALPTVGASTTSKHRDYVDFRRDHHEEVPLHGSTAILKIPLPPISSSGSLVGVSTDLPSDDDDSPKAVTIVSGKEEAKTIEKHTRRAIAAYKTLWLQRKWLINPDTVRMSWIENSENVKLPS